MSVQSRRTAKPRRRRTYLAAEDRRAQILATAKDVFARRGYHGASVDHICQAAQIARGTLYQYFDNKREVLMAFVEGVAERVAAIIAARPRIEDVPGIERSRLSQIEVFCRARLREVLETIFVDESTLRILLREARGADGAIEAALARLDTTLLSALEADLRAAQRAGLMRKLPAPLVARYVLGGIEKIILSNLENDEALDLTRVIDVAIEIQLHGLLTDAAREP